MQKTWKAIGISAFWLTWPALWVYLRRGKRTRILIIYKDEFLVLRGWLGAGDWTLPGGGLHKGENSLQGVIREVTEETGLALFEHDILFLQSAVHGNKGLRFSYDSFYVTLKARPHVTVQKGEISAHAWQRLDAPDLCLSPDTRAILQAWQNKA